MRSQLKVILVLILSLAITALLDIISVIKPAAVVILTPVLILLYVIGFVGLITLVLIITHWIKRKRINNSLLYITAISIGLFIGNLLSKPIIKWDNQQRNFSGQIITSALDKYKKAKGYYPEKLYQINLDSLNIVLPKYYKSTRFVYSKRDTAYNLDIPLLLDQWHWDLLKKEFVYSDF